STSSNYIGYAVNNYINIIDWGGNKIETITTNVDGDGEFFDWSPDSKEIVFENNSSGNIFISKYNFEMKVMNILTKGEFPSWKINQNIVYVFYNGSTYLLYQLDSNNQVIPSNVDIYGKFYPQYINNGNEIALFSNDGYLYKYNLNYDYVASSNISLTNFLRVNLNLSGNKIVYDIEHKHIGITDIDGANKKQIK
ncbi:MAG: hypothetical protein DKM50_04265, partial [Candidatus Margulisiibacteriota bacterium]